METQSVGVSGSNNDIYVAGRDVTISQQFEATEFFEPKLDKYRPPEFPEPRCAKQAIEALLRQRLILIGDSPGIDKAALCRHFAWSLRETLSISTNGAKVKETIAIQEWGPGTDPPNFGLILRQTKSKTIFILPQIKPQDIGYAPRKLADAARDSNNYVISCTDAPSQAWDSALHFKDFWCSFAPEDVYEPNTLVKILCQLLNEASGDLASVLGVDSFEPDQSLNGKSTVRAISLRLGTPERISLFVRLLRSERKQVSTETVDRLVESARNDESDENTLALWYRLLRPREQMLALGLSLFEQFFDDQFFAAFEYLVEQVWHRRDESLRAIDYCDLDELHNFFNLVSGGDDGINIQGRLPEQRRRIFEAVWHSHRRHLLAALPALVQLAKDSVRGIGANHELYGTYARRDQLRRAVSDSISDIGLISSSAVELVLLQLAADEDLAVQAIAARAIARWRGSGQDDVLSQTLKKWEQDTRFLKIISSYIEGEAAEQKEAPIYYIRATIALTTGYAAYYDLPNQLSPDLCDLLRELSDDRNRFVRNRFCHFTLPMITRFHLRQMSELLWDMALKDDLTDSIAWSFAEAHRVSPEETEEILDSWFHRNRNTRPKEIKHTETSDYEKRLAAIALAWGWIEYDQNKSQKGFEVLEHILREEESFVVRQAVIVAMSLQAKRDFQKVAHRIQHLMTYIAHREQAEIVGMLTHVYLDQRSRLTDCNETIKVGGRSVKTRTDGTRQLTAIETETKEWIKDHGHEAAQKIATQAWVAFAKSLDQEEARKIEELIDEREQEAERTERKEEELARAAAFHPLERSLDWYTKGVLWIIARNKSDGLANILKEVFREAIEQRREDGSAMSFVLERWRDLGDDAMDEISQALDSAFKWHDRRRSVLMTLVVSLAALFLISYFAFLSA